MHMRVYNPAAPARAAPQRQQWTHVLRVSRTAFPQLPRPSPHLLPPFFFLFHLFLGPILLRLRPGLCSPCSGLPFSRTGPSGHCGPCPPPPRLPSRFPFWCALSYCFSVGAAVSVRVSVRLCLFPATWPPPPLIFSLPHCSGCRWRSAICLTGWSGTGGQR